MCGDRVSVVKRTTTVCVCALLTVTFPQAQCLINTQSFINTDVGGMFALKTPLCA